ncbi:hypothetical protein [Lacrimispora indolis]|uniref:hypothetical protein n=1 Tax=Lacrimispora indolis TaxID=69825 RepID=UPI00045E8CD8|nr:hypothetical protein [Lacrimispora indolis]
MKRSWDFGDFEITLREVIASVTIVAVMFLIGFVIAGKIEAYQMDKNAEYNKAVHITDTEMFRYGMDTSLGNAFVYGNLQAVDPVTYPEIGGEYLYVEKVKERYTRHTRTVHHSNGKTSWTTTETYWTWDKVGSENIHSNNIRFLEIEFPYGKVVIPHSEYMETIKESNKIRYKYYGCPKEHTGSIYTFLKDGTIADNTEFFKNMNIEEALNQKTSGIGLWLFWIFWIALTGVVMFGFYYLDNGWLE